MKIAMHKCVLWTRASGSGRFLNVIQNLLGNGSATSITGPVRRPAPTFSFAVASRRIMKTSW